MAKLGEGDARWIVAEREDGTNVKGWHWQEKDALEWTRGRLSALLGNKTLADADGVAVRTGALLSCTGDSIINRRKGKIIPSFELAVKVAWEGTDAAGRSAKGIVDIPYIGDENAGDDDLEVKFTAEGDGEADRACKAAALKHGLQLIRDGVATWVAEMAAGGPGGAGPAAAADAQHGGGGAAAAAPAANKPAAAAAAKPRREESADGGTHTIRLEEKFYCRPSDIFEALTVAGRVRAFTQSECEVSAAPGAPFSFFGGNIHGSNEEVEPPKRLVQRWRFRNWAADVYSRVVITLAEPEYGTTVLSLEQSGVPARDKFGNETVLDTTEAGWKQNFFDRIRKVFGYGA